MGPGRLVASTLALGPRTWASRILAGCKFVLGSNCRIECGGPTMEPGTWGRLERGKLELGRGKLELGLGRIGGHS